jgi:hypothetical protein
MNPETFTILARDTSRRWIEVRRNGWCASAIPLERFVRSAAQILLLKNVCKDLPSEVLQQRSMRTAETLLARKKIAKGAEKRAG